MGLEFPGWAYLDPDGTIHSDLAPSVTVWDDESKNVIKINTNLLMYEYKMFLYEWIKLMFVLSCLFQSGSTQADFYKSLSAKSSMTVVC